jgi:hypothetical protein
MKPVTHKLQEVRLYFFDENDKPLVIYEGDTTSKGWQMKTPDCIFDVVVGDFKIESKQSDGDTPNVTYSSDLKSNELSIMFYAGRHGETKIASDYINEGYGTDLTTDNKGNLEFPKTDHPELKLNGFDDEIECIQNGDKKFIVKSINKKSDSELTKFAATMAVDGTFHSPKSLNFYFPITITTKEGVAMNMVLAQSGSRDGWKHDIQSLVDAGKDSYECFEAYEEGNIFKGLKSVAGVMESVSDIFKSNNPWYITFVGDSKNPASVIQTNDIVGLSIVGTKTSGDNKGKKQMTYTSTTKGDTYDGEYSFKVTIVNEK